ARIAPDPQHHVRLPRAQNPDRLREGGGEAEQRAQQPADPLALEALHTERLQRPTIGRHHARLEAAIRPHEEDLVAGVSGGHLFGDRDSREEGTAGPSARNQQPHATTSRTAGREPVVPRAGTASGAGRLAALMERSTPAAPIIMMRDEPPYEMNGRVNPLVGSSPMATHMFTMA